MCGRVTITSEAQTIADAIGRGLLLMEEVAPLLAPRYNLSPTQEMLCARPDPVDARRAHPALLRWGLVPSWSKDASGAARMINARSETVLEKPAFRSAAKARRCIAIIDGFYEWRRPASGPKRPFHFRVKGGRPFAVAALWEAWRASAEAPPLETCTMLTTSANALMAPIHDRMPVILEGEGLLRWLDPQAQGRDALGPLFAPFDPDRMEAWPVSTLVNSPRNDDPRLRERVPDEASDAGAREGPPPPAEGRHEQGTLF